MAHIDSNPQWRKLAMAAQAGDRQSYHRLIMSVIPAIESFIKRRVGVLVSVEDVVQEALMAMHKALPTYDSERSFSNWMFAIVKFRMIDSIRQGQRLGRHESSDEDDLEQLAGAAPNADSEARHSAMQYLNMLPDNYREVLVLTKIEGYSVQETADKLNLSTDNVKARCSRGIKKLRTIVEAEA